MDDHARTRKSLALCPGVRLIVDFHQARGVDGGIGLGGGQRRVAQKLLYRPQITSGA